jgi:hypothetical protein
MTSPGAGACGGVAAAGPAIHGQLESGFTVRRPVIIVGRRGG